MKKCPILLKSLVFLMFLSIVSACANEESKGSENITAEPTWLPDSGSAMGAEEDFLKEFNLEIKDIYMPPVKAGGTAKVFLTLHNQSDEEVGLHDAFITDVSYNYSIYDGSEDFVGGSIDVPAGEKLQLEEGVLYLVFEDVRKDMEVGDTFSLDLYLTPMGDISVQGTVKE